MAFIVETAAALRATTAFTGRTDVATATYGSTARFDGSARALTEDELRRVAPSVFATEAHHSRSERFQPIPTIEVIRALAGEGYSVVGAHQSRTRDASKREFTKHLLRLRRLDDKSYQVGDTVAEMLMRNANDGTGAYNLMSGFFRISCLNSLVRHTDTIEQVTIRHTGTAAGIQQKVIEGTVNVLNETRAALATPDAWRQIKLNREEARAFAQAAHEMRFGEAEEGALGTVITADQLLRPRRREDMEGNLWSTFNVLQENAVRGGLRGVRVTTNEDGRTQRRNVTTREVKGVDQLVGLNKALWKLAATMADLKGHKELVAA